MLYAEALVGIKVFIWSVSIYFATGVISIYYNICDLKWITTIFLMLTLLVCTAIKFMFKGKNFQIAIRAALLACVFAVGMYIKAVAPRNMKIFGPYLCTMALFHFTEFFAIALILPKQVTQDSFVINHSPQYIIAAVSSWIEFFVEAYFFPGLKQIYWLSNIGLVICIVGEALRKIAMFTAGSNFNHLVQREKRNDHVLVTHGVYGLFRHPSYVGWFYWSIGTQLILINPICIPCYAVVSWLFFKNRVYMEEITLLSFFGQQYCDYQSKVGTGLPFIEGYKM